MDMFIGFVLGFLTLLFLYCLLDDTDLAIADLEEQIRSKDALIDSLTKERQDKLNVNALQSYWPDMKGVPDGIDRFAQYPISGEEVISSADRSL